MNNARMVTKLLLKPITLDHLRAVKERDQSVRGLEMRAEYCDFMLQSARTDNEAQCWAHSAELRRKEAQRILNLQSLEG